MVDSSVNLVSSVKSFDGFQNVYSHTSKELNCDMKFAIYLPPGNSAAKPHPVLYWLSGLTCDENNCVQKSGFQRYAAEYGIIVVCPDTSPRNVNIAGEDESYDFGSGAGFYVDATKDPWKQHYRMFSYVTSELIALINANFPTIKDKQSIFGHSMGGHGALICSLKNPGLFKSVSAFAPISNPIECAWGKKAFGGYLGDNVNEWKQWDATELISKYNGPALNVLIDQGGEDNFLKQNQLLPENFVKAAKSASVEVIYNEREGYDHSYFFIASFIREHLAHHNKFLN